MLEATNGDTLIGTGTKARGMGGVGIAMAHGAESGLANPALITSVENTEVSFGGTVFMPDMKAQMGAAAKHTSAADMNVIPEISIAHKINENWFIGIGMWGTAGMGVDYRDATQTLTDSGNMHMVTNLQLMQFGVPIAYKTAGLSVAISPVLQYGALDMGYTDFSGNSVGDGVAQDLKFGFNAGLSYDLSNGLTLGAIYKSKINMDYGNQLSNATQPFVDLGIFPGAMADNLEQPSEVGVGMAYEMNQHTFAFDYKKIKWGNAKGYKDFGWEDQNVYAVGYQYTQDNFALRAGYNRASHPITESPSGRAAIPAADTYKEAGGNALNLFNVLGFPATAEKHYTLGGTYQVSNAFAIDLAYVHAPKTTTTMNTVVGYNNNETPNNPNDDTLYTGPSTVEHTENSVSFQLTYTF